MAHVFVSYDREDRDFAEVVQAKLQRAGHETSMDFDILSAGDDWQDKLDLAIRASDALVVVMGPEARASDYVAYEWAFALGAGVRVIPLALKATAFPPRLDGLHRLDFTEKKRPWDTLLAEVARAEASRRPAPDDPDTPPAVQQALRGIDSLDSNERLAAVKTLAQTDHPTALAALTRALAHPVSDVRAAAACAFPDRGNPRIVPGLIAAYRIELDEWRAKGTHGEAPEARLLLESASRLGASGVAVLSEPLAQLSPEPASMPLREALLQALAQTRSAAAVPPLQNALDDIDPQIRWTATRALGSLEHEAAAPALRKALTDSDADVRKQAAEGLGWLKDTAAVATLVDLLANDVPVVRAKAAEALCGIGDRSTQPALLAALQDDSYAVRKAAADALGRLGDDAVVPQLRSLLPLDNNGQLNELDMTVMAALVRLGDAASLDRIGTLLVEFRSGHFGGDVYAELARYGDQGIEVLLRILNSERRSSTQPEAAKALATIARPDVVSAVRAWNRKQR